MARNEKTQASRNASGKRSEAPVDLGRALIEAVAISERVNQVLLEELDPALWRAFPPSSPRRNIATSFAHIHNVRRTRLKMSAKGARLPEKLDRGDVTIAQAR